MKVKRNLTLFLLSLGAMLSPLLSAHAIINVMDKKPPIPKPNIQIVQRWTHDITPIILSFTPEEMEEKLVDNNLYFTDTGISQYMATLRELEIFSRVLYEQQTSELSIIKDIQVSNQEDINGRHRWTVRVPCKILFLVNNEVQHAEYQNIMLTILYKKKDIKDQFIISHISSKAMVLTEELPLTSSTDVAEVSSKEQPATDAKAATKTVDSATTTLKPKKVNEEATSPLPPLIVNTWSKNSLLHLFHFYKENFTTQNQKNKSLFTKEGWKSYQALLQTLHVPEILEESPLLVMISSQPKLKSYAEKQQIFWDISSQISLSQPYAKKSTTRNYQIQMTLIQQAENTQQPLLISKISAQLN
jgi:hypothetical protein